MRSGILKPNVISFNAAIAKHAEIGQWQWQWQWHTNSVRLPLTRIYMPMPASVYVYTCAQPSRHASPQLLGSSWFLFPRARFCERGVGRAVGVGAAALYYLAHTRSCAAASAGSRGGRLHA
eukprot:4131712-Karenia_brevis.AAC.1